MRLLCRPSSTSAVTFFTSTARTWIESIEQRYIPRTHVPSARATARRAPGSRADPRAWRTRSSRVPPCDPSPSCIWSATLAEARRCRRARSRSLFSIESITGRNSRPVVQIRNLGVSFRPSLRRRRARRVRASYRQVPRHGPMAGAVMLSGRGRTKDHPGAAPSKMPSSSSRAERQHSLAGGNVLHASGRMG
jgi:hypothetical protein